MNLIIIFNVIFKDKRCYFKKLFLVRVRRDLEDFNKISFLEIDWLGFGEILVRK